MSAKILRRLLTLSLLLLLGCGDARADPVRVVDAKSRRVMTERDVIALSNIHHFAVTESAPHHHNLSRRQIEDLVSLLNRRIAETGRMPQFFSEAADYWVDLQRDWPGLSTAQQRHTREYAASMLRMGPPSQQSARAARSTGSQAEHRTSAHRHSTHDHKSCDCDHRSSRNHRHTHDHGHHHGHTHSRSGPEQRGSSGQRQSSRHNPASVTAEVTNAPLVLDSIFPP